MLIRTEKDIDILKEGGKRLSSILSLLKEKTKAGVSAYILNEIAETEIKKMGDRPSFLNYRPKGAKNAYPYSICISINDEIVHGMPLKDKIIQEGDIVSIDAGLVHKGLFTDSAITVPVGKIDKNGQKLINAVKEALKVGIKNARVGAYLGDIGSAIEEVAKRNNFGLVRDLAGHGVGLGVHEDPFVPNYGKKGCGEKIKNGLVIAIEPMFNEGDDDIFLDIDTDTYKTRDGKRSAHFEHTLIILDKETIVVTGKVI